MPIPPISITAFGGEIPAVDARLINDNNANNSTNAWLFSGRIEPIHSLIPLYVPQNSATRSWFRLPIANVGVEYMVDSYWLEFENENVRVIRSPVVGQDDSGRYYWADGLYPKYITGDMIKNGDPPLKLGVPTPAVAPGVTITGGVSTINKTVSYVYTWVTQNGEEGPPSPPTTVTGKIDATYHLTMSVPTVLQTANRQLTKTRIYRTVISAQGVANFYFVAELPIATLTYDDNCAVMTDAVIISNETLNTVTWSAPPHDLQGLVTMPNGMIAGWRKNEVWFCEPYYPHAWPVQYIIGVDPTIVGLGVYNQSLIILCEGQPYAATGIRPGAMALSKVQPLEPCTSRRSIVNTPNGVLYASPNGLVNITPAGAVNLTIQKILKDQWSGRTNLASVMASIIAQGYYYYAGQQGDVFQLDAFQFDVDNPDPTPDVAGAFQERSHFGTRPGGYISLTDDRLGVTVLDPTPIEVQNVITDIFNGETMVMRDGIIYLVDIRKQGPYGKYRWRSKIFTLPYLQNLGAAKVYWTPQDKSVADQPNYFRVFAAEKAKATEDGLPIIFQQQMRKSGEMFRLPSGFKAQYYQFEVEGYCIVNAIHAAQTAHMLRNI